MAKWNLPRGGALLGRDIVWETRVRYRTPLYFWFAIWAADNKREWDGHAQGAEHDLVESFGYDNGGGNTNYDGRFFIPIRSPIRARTPGTFGIGAAPCVSAASPILMGKFFEWDYSGVYLSSDKVAAE